MVLILLIVSLVGLILFFILKFKKRTLASLKSDSFFEDRISCFVEKQIYLLKFIYDFPIFLNFLSKRIKSYLTKFYKIIVVRILKKLEVNGKLKLSKNRGVVSVFLRTISEEKIKNKK